MVVIVIQEAQEGQARVHSKAFLNRLRGSQEFMTGSAWENEVGRLSQVILVTK